MAQIDPRRRSGLPLGATLMTLLMVPLLIAMGIWQLQSRDWKAHINAEIAAAPTLPGVQATLARR